MDTWWLRLPLAARRLSPRLGTSLLDGCYLVAWPWLGAALPPIALGAGLLTGSTRWMFSWTFAESLGLMAGATLLGVMGAQLGAMFLTGFALGQLFTTYWSYPQGPSVSLLLVIVPLLIDFGVLGLLVVNVPLLTKALVSELRPPVWIGRGARFGLALMGHAALTWGLVYLWAQAAPVLIRPSFVWLGGQPTVAAVQPLQTGGTLLAWIGALASLARMVLQGLTASRSRRGRRLDFLQRQLADQGDGGWGPNPSPSWVTVTLRAFWSTLLLAGMLTTWLDAILLALVSVLLQAMRSDLLRLPIDWWRAMANRVPLLLRLAVGMLLVRLISRWMLQSPLSQTETFRPFTVITALALMVLFVLSPGIPAVGREEAR